MKGLKLLGHPLHAAIVHFPIATWTAAVVTDVLALALPAAWMWDVSRWILIVGVVTGLGAMTAGFVDLIAVPSGSHWQKRALRHMYVMSSAWTVYAIDLLLRLMLPAADPALQWTCLGLTVAGFLVLAVGAHFGASLVYDLGMGQTGNRKV